MLESQRVNRTSSFSTGITRPPLFRARIPANGRPAALRLSEIKAAAGWPSCPVAFQALAAGHSKRRELGTGILPCADVSLVSSGAGSSAEWLEHSAWLSRSKFQDKVPSSPPSQKTKKNAFETRPQRPCAPAAVEAADGKPLRTGIRHLWLWRRDCGLGRIGKLQTRTDQLPLGI